MIQTNVGDRVTVVDLPGSYRITSIEGRKHTAHREFVGGVAGNVRKFDVLDVLKNFGTSESLDTGIAPPQALEDKGSLRLEAKMQKEREGNVVCTPMTRAERKAEWSAVYSS